MPGAMPLHQGACPLVYVLHQGSGNSPPAARAGAVILTPQRLEPSVPAWAFPLDLDGAEREALGPVGPVPGSQAGAGVARLQQSPAAEQAPLQTSVLPTRGGGGSHSTRKTWGQGKQHGERTPHRMGLPGGRGQGVVPQLGPGQAARLRAVPAGTVPILPQCRGWEPLSLLPCSGRGDPSRNPSRGKSPALPVGLLGPLQAPDTPDTSFAGGIVQMLFN